MNALYESTAESVRLMVCFGLGLLLAWPVVFLCFSNRWSERSQQAAMRVTQWGVLLMLLTSVLILVLCLCKLVSKGRPPKRTPQSQHTMLRPTQSWHGKSSHGDAFLAGRSLFASRPRQSAGWPTQYRIETETPDLPSSSSHSKQPSTTLCAGRHTSQFVLYLHPSSCDGLTLLPKGVFAATLQPLTALDSNAPESAVEQRILLANGMI